MFLLFTGLDKLWLFFNTRFSTSKMIGDFNFIVFKKSLIIKFTAIFRFYSKIRSHSNERWHWILLIWINNRWFIKWQNITRPLPKRMHRLNRSISYKISLPSSFLRLLHLPCMVMLIVCFYVLIHENVVTTVYLYFEFATLVILNLFVYLGVCFIFIILWINQLLLTSSLLWLSLLTFQYLFLCFRNQIFLNFNCFVYLFLLILMSTLSWFGLRLTISKNLVFASFDRHRQDF